MNLLTSGKEMHAKVVRVNSIESNNEILQTWVPVETALESWLEELESLQNLHKWFMASGHPCLDQISMPDKLDLNIEGLDKLIEKFSEDHTKAMQGSLWGVTSGGVTAVTMQLRTTLTEKWSEYVTACLPNIEHLRPFLDAGTTNKQIDELNLKIEQLRALAINLPDSSEKIKTVKEQGDLLKEKFQQLDFGDIPDEVARFIQKVNSFQGATLNDLSASVLDWLRERGLLENFLIKAGR